MKPRTFAALLGIALAIAGLVLMVLPTSASATSLSGRVSTVSCGGMFGGLSGILGGNNGCADSNSTRAVWVWAMVGLGVVVLVGSRVGTKGETAPTPTA